MKRPHLYISFDLLATYVKDHKPGSTAHWILNQPHLNGLRFYTDNLNLSVKDMLYCFGIDFFDNAVQFTEYADLDEHKTSIPQKLTAGIMLAKAVGFAFSGPDGKGVYYDDTGPMARVWFQWLHLCCPQPDDSPDINGDSLVSFLSLILEYYKDNKLPCPVCTHDGDGPDDYAEYTLCSAHQAERTRPSIS